MSLAPRVQMETTAVSNVCDGWFYRVGLRGNLPLGLVCLALIGCGAATEAQDEDRARVTTPGGGGSPGESSMTTASRSAGTVGTGEVACPCSRRPGANNSSMCAIGLGETMTRVVGPGGGDLSLHGQQGASSGVDFRIDILPESLSEDVEVQITETTDPPPVDLVDYSPIYRVEPTDVGAQFPIDLTIPYGGNDGIIPATLAIYVATHSAGPFEALPDSYINAGFLQGSTTRFGVFLAGSTRTPDLAGCP